MNRNFLRASILLSSTVLVAVLISAEAAAIRVTPPPTREYASQTWVGVSTDDRYTIRIILNLDGTGSGVLLSAETPEPFDVTSWVLNQSHITLSVRFHNREISASRITGTFKQHLLSYTEGMLPHPARFYEHALPGPLELVLKEGKARTRFGAWPEHLLEEQLQHVKYPKGTGAPGGA